MRGVFTKVLTHCGATTQAPNLAGGGGKKGIILALVFIASFATLKRPVIYLQGLAK